MTDSVLDYDHHTMRVFCWCTAMRTVKIEVLRRVATKVDGTGMMTKVHVG